MANYPRVLADSPPRAFGMMSAFGEGFLAGQPGSRRKVMLGFSCVIDSKQVQPARAGWTKTDWQVANLMLKAIL